MGPRLFSRGNHVATRRCEGSYARFNGAAAFQPRKRWTSWPPRCKRTPLQWGRGFSAAETVEVGRRRCVGPVASMGPRLFSRGNTLLLASVFVALRASMGPRLFSRGNNPDCEAVESAFVSFNGAAAFQPRKLQGHNTGPPRIARLQWGRGFSAAETCRLLGRWRGACTRFNGAAAFQPRKRESPGAWAASPGSASMGPRLFSRGNGQRASRPAGLSHRFNGAAAFQPRKRRNPRQCSLRGFRLQWGRGFSAAETLHIIVQMQ